jgi:hypothetical protein
MIIFYRNKEKRLCRISLIKYAACKLSSAKFSTFLTNCVPNSNLALSSLDTNLTLSDCIAKKEESCKKLALIRELRKETRNKYVSLIVENFKKNNHYPTQENQTVSEYLVTTMRTPEKLSNVKLDHKQLPSAGFHPIVLSVICGTVFGDSSLSIQKNFANARMEYKHSTRQTEWFLWKTLYIMNEIIKNQDAIQFDLPSGYQEEVQTSGFEQLGKLQVITKATEELTKVYSVIVSGGKKTIKRKWLNHMNNYFLMTMWLDDGSLMGELGCQGCISTGTMPKAEAEILVKYFKDVWGFQCKVIEKVSQIMQNGVYPTRIDFIDQNQLMIFLRIVAPIIPVKSMIYKVCFFPIGVPIQQRWATELKDMIRPEWHDEIDQILYFKRFSQLTKEIKIEAKKVNDLNKEIIKKSQ